MPFDEENDTIGVDDNLPIEPQDLLEIQNIDLGNFLPVLDSMMDMLDAAAVSLDEAAFDALSNQTLESVLQQLTVFLEANKDKKGETVIVTGKRGTGIGGTIRNSGIYVSAQYVALRGMLTPQQKANLKANIKAMIPGVTDEELEILYNQVLNSKFALKALLVGNVEVRIENGKTIAYISRSQMQTIQSILVGLNSPESIRALNLFNNAIKAKVVLVRPR